MAATVRPVVCLQFNHVLFYSKWWYIEAKDEIYLID